MYKGFKTKEAYLEYQKKYNKNRPKKPRKDKEEHKRYTAQRYKELLRRVHHLEREVNGLTRRQDKTQQTSKEEGPDL